MPSKKSFVQLWSNALKLSYLISIVLKYDLILFLGPETVFRKTEIAIHRMGNSTG